MSREGEQEGVSVKGRQKSSQDELLGERTSWCTSVVRLIFVFAACLLASSAFAGEGHQSIRQHWDDRLSSTEKEQVIKALRFRVSKDTHSVLLERTENCGDTSPTLETVDLNGDGIDELFVSYGNSCACGIAGRCLALFVKDSNGIYIMNFDFSALGYVKLPIKNQGFPELTFEGPGFCQGIWAWNGKTYEHVRNEPTIEGCCDEIERMRSRR
jgi:hypothetical protein